MNVTSFQAVATVGQIPEGRGIAVEVGGRRIAIFHVDGGYRAVEAGCSRHQAPLEKGAVEDETLYCPWHGAGFDLDTGVCSAFPDEVSGKLIDTKVEGDSILVAV